MTTPSNPSAELAEQCYQRLVGDSEFRRDSLAIWKPEIMAAIRAAISQASADLTATRKKLAEKEASNLVQFSCLEQLRSKTVALERELKESEKLAAHTTGEYQYCTEKNDALRAQNLALEAQVGEMRKALEEAKSHLVYTDYGTASEKEYALQKSLPQLINSALSRTPSTVLGEIREKVKDILDAVSEEMQPCENEGVPNYPDILDDVHAKLTQLLTTLTGEKK